ncbi:hypothetical protein PV518_41550 [Streptomyces sp. ND04-05B]|uniref:hypothetical protein n=1 Tax=Streptomyces sp. ND04-05B TaxID=3028693 RepID=UPI0029B63AAE|nr:hypothetical protein [Streptomyces sp. ND04-05B]MDX3068561.1 hypothetical protein [Streptomyces sp. ND04-05B]
MSRGHGRIERAILDALPPWPRGLSRTQLARIIFHTADPTRSQKVSVQRAVRALAVEGRVEIAPERLQVVGTYRRGNRLVDLVEADVHFPRPPEGSPELSRALADVEKRMPARRSTPSPSIRRQSTEA